MARRSPPRKVTYFEPVPPRRARNTVIESTFDVGRRFRCSMRVDCHELDPGVVIAELTPKILVHGVSQAVFRPAYSQWCSWFSGLVCSGRPSSLPP